MAGDTTKLTLRLSREKAAFAEAYAKTHGLSVSELIGRYLRRMAARHEQTPVRGLETIAGLVPREVDAQAESRRYRQNKYSP